MKLTDEIRAKRVAVAQDVIRWIIDKERPLRVVSGSYITGSLHSEKDLSNLPDFAMLSCAVCALGAAVLAKARLFGDSLESVCNKNDVDDLIFSAEANAVYSALEDIFDPRTRTLIESAFEWDDMSVGRRSRVFEDEICRAINFGQGYFRHVDRLRAIYQNIIDNNGEFVP